MPYDDFILFPINNLMVTSPNEKGTSPSGIKTFFKKTRSPLALETFYGVSSN